MGGGIRRRSGGEGGGPNAAERAGPAKAPPPNQPAALIRFKPTAGETISLPEASFPASITRARPLVISSLAVAAAAAERERER